MNRIIILTLALAACISLGAQELTEAQKAAIQAANAVSNAEQKKAAVEKPKYWKTWALTNLDFGQTTLTNWAAGGDNTVTLRARVDGNAQWKKDEMFWNNRLQCDYGFIYASSKPILQKNQDLFYLESKWGYKAVKTLYLSADFSFRTQFANGWNYNTPAAKTDDEGNPIDLTTKDWKDARQLKSSILSPGYTTLALGLDWNPAKWLSVNFAPATGGFTIVNTPSLRKRYGMHMSKEGESLHRLYNGKTEDDVNQDQSLNMGDFTKYKDLVESGRLYRGARFEFGAQLKINSAININNKFAYSTQLVLFSNYLDKPQNLRVYWDNSFSVKIAKFFSVSFTTNLIYDDKVMIASQKGCKKHSEACSHQRIQFKEYLGLGFAYTFAKK